MYSITIRNSFESFKVRKILCVGANYKDHIAEMNPGKPLELPTEPVIFMKPPTALISDGGKILRPAVSNEMHHEVELIIVIGEGGKNIAKTDAEKHILGYAVGLDMTLRDLQTEAKKKGRPWTIAKAFDTSALVSEVVLRAEAGNVLNQPIRLYVNDTLRQDGNTSDMIFSPADIIAYVSQVFTLEKGDLIYTGTPKGVGPAVTGDRLKAVLGNNLITVEATVG